VPAPSAEPPLDGTRLPKLSEQLTGFVVAYRSQPVLVAPFGFASPLNVTEVVPVSAQERHLLYPELGLDLVLNADGKDVLQYLSPDDFDTHRAQLQVKN